MDFWNLGILPQHYTVSQSKRPRLESTIYDTKERLLQARLYDIVLEAILLIFHCWLICFPFASGFMESTSYNIIANMNKTLYYMHKLLTFMNL